MYCCNGTGNKDHVNVEGIRIPLSNDPVLDRFRRLHEFVSDQQKSKGSLFSNRSIILCDRDIDWPVFCWKSPRQRIEGQGYGHMGCCTLLAIQRVLSIDKVVSNIKPGELSCYTEGWHENRNDELLRARQNTISKTGERWRTSDPQRVAAEALSDYLHNSNTTLNFAGCHTKHLTYSDKKDDQYSTSCSWASSSSGSYTVEVMKFYFLKSPSNKWKDIAWMPYETTHQHCSDSSTAE